jgi:RNA polymerase sigma-70 factor (ECF subfamily)
MSSSENDPKQLLRLAREGSEAALGQLLELYRHYLALLAQLQIGRLLQGKVDDTDLVQETFLKAYENFGRFQGTTEAELIGWLRQILASRLVDLLRRCGAKRRDVRLERDLAAELEQSSRILDQGLMAQHSSPSEQAARREQSVLLANALGQLPNDYRQVIILHHLEDLNFPEVARRMGRTLNSVKNLWIRALARLRTLLGERQHEPE